MIFLLLFSCDVLLLGLRLCVRLFKIFKFRQLTVNNAIKVAKRWWRSLFTFFPLRESKKKETKTKNHTNLLSKLSHFVWTMIHHFRQSKWTVVLFPHGDDDDVVWIHELEFLFYWWVPHASSIFCFVLKTKPNRTNSDRNSTCIAWTFVINRDSWIYFIFKWILYNNIRSSTGHEKCTHFNNREEGVADRWFFNIQLLTQGHYCCHSKWFYNTPL